MQELIIELENLRRQLNESIEDIRNAGYQKAKAEYNYRVALSQEILRERDGKMPVTIINDVVKGKANIAKLKFYRDNSETIYDAAYEKHRAIKIELGIVERQIESIRKGE